MPLKPTYFRPPSRDLHCIRTEAERAGQVIGRTKFTSSKPWAKFRRSFLASHPKCQDCEAEGRLSMATTVHHVIKRRDDPNGDHWFDEANCMALCESCHNRRTQRGE